MKKITRLVVLITTLCCVFSVDAQFRLVEQLRPFSRSFYNYNNKLYFQAHVGGGFYNLYVTDGTTSGAIVLREGSTSGLQIYNDFSSVGYNVFNSELYFDGRINNTSSVYKVSNNPSVVENVYDIAALPYSRFIDSVFLNDKIIFTPISSNGPQGVEPYVVDLINPANNGVLLDIKSGANHSYPRYFKVLNNNVFFAAGDGVNGRELWKTDGTAAGTALFLDINLGAGDSNPDQFNILGVQLAFAATYDVLGRELFKTNGNTNSLVLIKNINPGAGSSDPTNVTLIGQTLYFSANNGSVGHELWKSNGNSSGTVLIKDINPLADSNPSNFTLIDTDVYFVADDGVSGRELWKTDGTNAGTSLVKDINATGNSNIDNLIEYNGKLYFTADDGIHGEELWTSDGTEAGTVMLELNSIGSGDYSQLVVFNDELYFGADSGDGYGQVLYAYMDPALSVVDFDLNETSISLFPNPTSTYFEIESTEMISKVNVYSIQGQVVKSFEPQSHYDISDLSNGMYFVKIQANNSEVTKEIIKQ